MMNSLKNELFLFLSEYAKGTYPDYVLKNKLTDEIPVFIFHHIIPKEFEEQLQHLQKNGYRTLNADEMYEVLDKSAKAPQKSIVITFDDGLSDVYDVAYPLLKKYGYQAIVFLIPRWIGSPGVVTWDQVTEMHRSGVIDFQSHSLNHPAIFIADKVVDFFHPQLAKKRPWSIPLTNSLNEEKQKFPPQWGTPLYECASRFSNYKRYYPDIMIKQMCVDYVKEHGAEHFFQQRNWRRELKEIILKNNKIEGKYESPLMQADDILTELHESKHVLEERLVPKVVRHFACPWNQISGVAVQSLIKSGYVSAFIGLLQEDLGGIEVPGYFQRIRRVTGDFIRCLPGTGRKTFGGVLFSKMVRRLRSGAPY